MWLQFNMCLAERTQLSQANNNSTYNNGIDEKPSRVEKWLAIAEAPCGTPGSQVRSTLCVSLIVLFQVVRDSIPGQKVKLLIGCMPAPARTPLMCQSGHCSSVHPESHAGTGIAVPSNMARESKHSLYDGPVGRSSPWLLPATCQLSYR
jgi:hypothetical protein